MNYFFLHLTFNIGKKSSKSKGSGGSHQSPFGMSPFGGGLGGFGGFNDDFFGGSGFGGGGGFGHS